MDRGRWQEELESAEARLGLAEGFKFVYGPWATLHSSEVAFLSLNPGRPPDCEDLRTVSDERGNSYEVQRHVTKSPLNPQFLRLARFLDLAPEAILTGVASPFRSDNWNGLTEVQREEGLAFWATPLRNARVRLVFACSKEALHLVREITEASLTKELPAAWDKVRVRRFEGIGGKVIVQLPHLSRFKLFGRPESEKAIRRLLA